MEKVSMKMEKLPYEIEEQINTFRTNLQFSGVDKRVIMITSCIGSEGKSTTTYRLACSLAEMGKKVLMIDADMRKSVLVKQIKSGSAEWGLSHFLSGQCNLIDAVYQTNLPTLHVIFAGPVPPNPTELLESNIFSKTIDSCREIYDYILIDSAPLGMVIDAAIVAKSCDGAVMLMESGVIKYKIAQDVKMKIENAGCPVLGVVLNKIDISGKNGYYKQYYKKYESYGNGKRSSKRK